MKVLFASHTSEISGGERSLLDLLGTLPEDVEVLVACPPGPLAFTLTSRGIPVVGLNGTSGSLRLHPLHTARGIADVTRDGIAIARHAHRLGVDIVHANSIRAGLSAALARCLGSPATVVHVRDVLPDGLMPSVSLRAIGLGADVLVANSAYTAARVRRAGVQTPLEVVHSPVDLDRFDPSSVDRDAARSSLGLADGIPTLSLIAQITPWKGQAEAIRVLGRLRDGGTAARLLFVGSTKFVDAATRFDNLEYVRQVRSLAAELGVAEQVRFLGEREDIPQILAATELLLAPSWEEPFGRAVAEAMAMGVPVAATSHGGPAEMIVDGVTGVLLPPGEIELWAERTGRLLGSPETRAEIGLRARRHAQDRFGCDRHAEEMLRIYAAVIDRHRR